MIKPKLISALLFVASVSMTSGASAITVEQKMRRTHSQGISSARNWESRLGQRKGIRQRCAGLF
jgi:hypothetical protein